MQQKLQSHPVFYDRVRKNLLPHDPVESYKVSVTLKLVLIASVLAALTYVTGCATVRVHESNGKWVPGNVKIDEAIRSNGKIYVEYNVRYWHSRKHETERRARKWTIIDLTRKNESGQFVWKTVEPGFEELPPGESLPVMHASNHKEHFSTNFVLARNTVALYSHDEDENIIVATFDMDTGLPVESNYVLARDERPIFQVVSSFVRYPVAVSYDIATLPLQAGFIIVGVASYGFWPE